MWHDGGQLALNADRYMDEHAISKEEVLDNIQQVMNGDPSFVYDALSDDDDPDDE
jgi:hypothetical protein